MKNLFLTSSLTLPVTASCPSLGSYQWSPKRSAPAPPLPSWGSCRPWFLCIFKTLDRSKSQNRCLENRPSLLGQIGMVFNYHRHLSFPSFCDKHTTLLMPVLSPSLSSLAVAVSCDYTGNALDHTGTNSKKVKIPTLFYHGNEYMVQYIAKQCHFICHILKYTYRAGWYSQTSAKPVPFCSTTYLRST